MKQSKKIPISKQKPEQSTIDIETNINVIKPKRGRKSKKELSLSLNIDLTGIKKDSNNDVETNTNMKIDINELNTKNIINKEIELALHENMDDGENIILKEKDNSELNTKSISKKRGRKPKGGKIIEHLTPLNSDKKNKPNIILHLKCYLRDLNPNNILNNNIESYNFSNKNDLNYELINVSQYNTNTNNNQIEQVDYEFEDDDRESKDNNKELWKKIKQLENNLHLNNINDKKSACFWCTYDFDNPPIYIPKYFIKNTYHVYGCFCSPECATAFLMEENIDSSTKFERYHFINHLYAKIYNYEKNIKPAPNPYYMLDKFYGNLSIQEYRSLFKNERLFLIVDKPLTRVLPELHEDNDDFILNNKIIPSNNYNIKRKLQQKNQNKSNILNEKFGLSNLN